MLIDDVRPYHVTCLDNLVGILKEGALFSKEQLEKKGLSFEDLGWLEEEKGVIKLSKFKFRKEKDNKISFHRKDIEIDLRKYVRLYLFVLKVWNLNPIVPKFLFNVLQKRNQPIAVVIFKKLKKIVKWAGNTGHEYFLIYGHPNRKNPVAFEDLESLLNYLDFHFPGIDGLREWLKVILGCNMSELELHGNYYRFPYVRYGISEKKVVEPYLSQILSSELIIKDEIPLNLLHTIVLLLDENDDIKQIKKRIRKSVRGKEVNILVVRSTEDLLGYLSDLNRVIHFI